MLTFNIQNHFFFKISTWKAHKKVHLTLTLSLTPFCGQTLGQTEPTYILSTTSMSVLFIIKQRNMKAQNHTKRSEFIWSDFSVYIRKYIFYSFKIDCKSFSKYEIPL